MVVNYLVHKSLVTFSHNPQSIIDIYSYNYPDIRFQDKSVEKLNRFLNVDDRTSAEAKVDFSGIEKQNFSNVRSCIEQLCARAYLYFSIATGNLFH
jgi:hypothetical protein